MNNLPVAIEGNFLDRLEEMFHDYLLRALNSGALDEIDIKYPHSLLCSVLVITAENFTPRSDEGKKLLANLRHFV